MWRPRLLSKNTSSSSPSVAIVQLVQAKLQRATDEPGAKEWKGEQQNQPTKKSYLEFVGASENDEDKKIEASQSQRDPTVSLFARGVRTPSPQ
jgi:hypothetical protein